MLTEDKVNIIYRKMEDEISKITELPEKEVTNAMNALVASLRVLKIKPFISAINKYLMSTMRKNDVICRTYTPPAPPMSKSEQVLLYVIVQLSNNWPSVNLFYYTLESIEYTLFRLSHTPDFEQVENLAHFYAVLCRYAQNKNRLRLFMLDAMYCMSYKAIPLIKQCIDVWMHVIPLAHLSAGKINFF